MKLKNILKKSKQKPKEQPIPKEEKKKTLNVIKWELIISAAVFLLLILASTVTIFIKVGKLNPDQTILTFIYLLSIGWMAAIIMIVPVFIARKEIINKFKVFGRTSRVLIVRMIGGDANENEFVVKLTGNTIEVGENKIIINPRKSTMKNGVRVMTYVADNALAHNFFQDPKDTLKKIGERINSKKDEDFHDIFSDPIRIDAKYFNETFLAAQQTNPDILKKIIAFLTSKNVLLMLGVIAIAAAISAVLGLQANNLLNSIPYCNPTQITP